QNMSRRLRVEVIERHTNVILKHLCRRYPAVGYLTENTVVNTHDRMNQLKHKQLRIVKVLSGDFFGCGVEAALDTFNIGAKRAELSDDGFVAAVNVIDAVDRSFTLSTKNCQHKARC